MIRKLMDRNSIEQNKIIEAHLNSCIFQDDRTLTDFECMHNGLFKS